MPLAGLLCCHAEVFYDPSRNDLKERRESPLYQSFLLGRIYSARSVGGHEAWGDVEEGDVLLVIVGGEVIECQACAHRGMIYDRSDAPILREADVTYVDLLFFHTIEDREDPRLRRPVKRR